MGPVTGAIPTPTYDVERELPCSGGVPGVAGVDEVGRGAWAGPVVVGVAVTDGSPAPEGLTDCKRLAPKARVAMADQLRDWVVDHGLGRAEPTEIDTLGMTAALRLAAQRALDQLAAPPEWVLLDGKHDYLGTPWQVRTEIKADLTCVSVAAASVLAKVYRDNLMTALDPDFPQYAFASAVGYPSPQHRRALADLGPTRHHRMSWSYLDDLPQWRHLRKPRPGPQGQSALF
ncbi:ribonuclease HII [Spiractinospora alimapuensis]|uniref:ribonuclease HII n=1 Tax=Spiractinospora alimapuensis TaxID=2820884 RepID=UPI0037437BCE|nr:ribonuclease HII [Spiractinospora alimapuensis]